MSMQDFCLFILCFALILKPQLFIFEYYDIIIRLLVAILEFNPKLLKSYDYVLNVLVLIFNSLFASLFKGCED